MPLEGTMHKNTLARVRLDGAGWAHPYGYGPFGPVYADGGDGGGSASDGGQPGDGGTPDTDTGGAGQGGQPAASPWEGFQWDGKVDSLPDPVAKVIRDAREDAGKARTVAKQNAANEAREELLGTISAALGLEGDKPATPEELTRQLTQSQTALTAAQEQAASAAIELHVYRTAARLGADADRLLDSRSFCESIDSIDPSDPEAFNAAVEQAVQAAMGRDPGLRGRGAGRSGADLGGAGGSGDQAASIDKKIEAAMAARNFTEVIRLKRQRAATNT
jgi:hypothetical protein